MVPLTTPRATRYCPRCDTPTSFICSERFRVNGQGGRLDAWLIYRCAICEARWKLELFARRPVGAIPAELLAGLTGNDRDLAWRFAFDADLLRRGGARAELDVDWRVEPAHREGGRSGLLATTEVTIELAYPTIRLRLDRLLARQLGVSRSALARRCREGDLELPEGPRALRRPVRPGQRLLLPPRRLGDDQ